MVAVGAAAVVARNAADAANRSPEPEDLEEAPAPPDEQEGAVSPDASPAPPPDAPGAPDATALPLAAPGETAANSSEAEDPTATTAAQAQIQGLESDLNWAATYNLTISGGIALYDAKLTADYCGFLDASGNPATVCASPEAPKGTQLPVTAKVKGNLNARYTFDIGDME